MLSDHLVRVMGRACIHQYDQGVGPIWDIINSYDALDAEEKQQLYDYIVSVRPDIAEQEV